MVRYKSIAGQNTTLSVVVKSNAYGHGIKEMGTLCQESMAVDWLCTTSVSEALTLRNHGVTKPILSLSIIDEDPVYSITHNIDLPVFDLETAIALNAVGKQHNQKITIHIKIDTGMSRFGLMPDQALATIAQIYALPFITIRGLFTHCAEAANPDTNFTLQQLTIFDRICTELEQANIHIPLKHATNSASTPTMLSQFPNLNFVRIGAGAYGLQHFKDPATHAALDLKSILMWKTRVAHIKHVPSDTFVGYDRTHKTISPATIVTLPLGYFEGYDRRLSNLGIVFMNDFYAQVVGRICMNAVLVAIPENKHISLHDEVVLLGDYPQLSAYDIATTIGSFNAREITTRLNAEIKRIIVK